MTDEVYRLTIKGHLGTEWSEWFDGLHVTPADNGETILTGPVTDQTALHGLLCKIRDLGVPLLSLRCIKADDSDLWTDPATTAPPERRTVGRSGTPINGGEL